MSSKSSMALACVFLLATTSCATSPRVPSISEQSREAWKSTINEPGVEIQSVLGIIDDDLFKAIATRALESNPALRQTALSVLESQHRLGLPASDLLPSVDAVASTDRRDDLETIHTTITGGFRLSWELDVWGRLADQRESADAEHRALVHDLVAAQNSLVARTLQRALEYIYRREVIEIESRRVASLGANADVIRERFRRGLGPFADWDTARATLLSAEATLTQRREDLAHAIRALGALLGDVSFPQPDLPGELPQVHLPAIEVPAVVLGRRPDVAAAIERIRAASHRTGAARKALLPSFSISGSIDHSGRTMTKLLESDPVWAVIGSITAPLFDGGRRRAEASASAVAHERAWVVYREVLVTAVVEVETALGTENSLGIQMSRVVEANEYAQRSRATFEDRYSRGLVDVLDLLVAQRQAFDAELRVLDTRFQRLSNRINLGLALGLEIVEL